MTKRPIPIGDYGLVGDTRTAALVAPDGSIDWLCLPRFDSPPVFGRLIGGDEAGWFSIRPDEPAAAVSHRYRGDTATLVTTWEVEGGRLVVSDSMIAEVEGRALPATTLVRRVTALGRPIRVQAQIVARFGYRRHPPRRSRRHRDSLLLERGDLALAFTTDASIPLAPEEVNTFEVAPDRAATVVMTASQHNPLLLVPAPVGAAEAERDERRWQGWSDSIPIGPSDRSLLLRSFITLQLLTYSPSGAPVAAPTTSLPEELGGERNWDYRLAWPRDASIGISAFLAAGKHGDADSFMAWLLHASRLARPRLPALFTLDGRPAPAEQHLEGWPGYAHSRPVRIGNGAGGQHQLDGYGWILDAAWRMSDADHVLDGETWRAMKSFADYVADHWMLPDAGIWERRDGVRHHVHSKMMAWLAMDRMVRISEQRGRSPRRLGAWRSTRPAIRHDIRRHGYNHELGSYTAAYGSDELDAALLLLPSLGMEEEGSPRTHGTIEAVQKRLSAGGPLLFRYRDSDGLDGGEGAFLPCSFWMVQALALIGRRREAEEWFTELLSLGGELGLYGEEMDPSNRRHLGNFPQALTHSALLQAAIALGR